MSDWEKLQSQNRLRTSTRKRAAFDKRSNFDSDFDRVVFSSSFRRLQDKTQVFPLDSHDFVRTRLTHSSEVSAVGRNLAVSSAAALRDAGTISADYERPWSTIVATACLLHDIGNPPFGHSGEKYIGDWMQQKLSASKPTPDAQPTRKRSGIPIAIDDPHEVQDLTRFEGNAQAFRLATRLQTLGDNWGMNLTPATLSALIKYPCASTNTEKNSAKKSLRKFGFFKSDQHAFERVRLAVGLRSHQRHPLAFLVEAADDICYSVVDIEDALKKGIVSIETIVSELEDHLSDGIRKQFLDDVLKKRLGARPSRNQGQMAFQYFRAECVGHMASSCVEQFSANYEQILNGEFDSELTEKMELAPLCAALKGIAERKVYDAQEVVEVEEAGKHVIWGLLDIFYDELSTAQESRLIKTYLPETPVNPGDTEIACSDHYKRVQRVFDYVAGMTDTFAFTLYRRLTGVTPP